MLLCTKSKYPCDDGFWAWLIQNIADHKATMSVLLDRGVELVMPSDVELAEWQAAADAEASRWMSDDIIPESTYSQMKDVLQRVRSN